MRTRTNARHALALGISALAVTAALVAPAPVAAQTSTAQLRGQVRDASGAPAAGASVVAVNIGTNQAIRGTTDAAGAYALTGLRPATYDVTITGADGERFTRRIIVSIGQSATLDATLGAPTPTPATEGEEPAPETAGTGDDIVVTGSRLREVKTSEIATNVTQQQIRTLPQTDRNFLSFAALAPGVRYNDSETDRGFQSGATGTSQVNVFIDGVSLKNKLREGGVAGQQNSRGNPFGQLAVQEFRVLTQNYKAEYEQAGSAIITSVTKSGTNEFHGEAFGQYTDRSLTQKSFIDIRDGNPKPAFERKQYGASLGGPIIKDKLFFFLTYEGNDQDRAFNVNPGINADAEAVREFQAATGRNLADFRGAFVSPFRQDFYFGKLTLTPDDRQTFDVSFSRREETDIQGFGGNTAFEYAENKINKVDTYLFKWTYAGDNFTNEFNVNYLDYLFNPTALNPGLPSFDYAGVVLFGGKDSTRRETQQSYTIRNDLTWRGLDDHVVKFGARIEVTDIAFFNNAYIQPRYTFNRGDDAGTPNDPSDDLNFTFPSEARLGLGNGRVFGSNTQYGLYLQDDWNVTERLQLNLGVRYDYETNAKNNGYITPPNAAAALRALPRTDYFDPENYISTGNRRPFAGAIAPRFGFSWDLTGEERTVIFGGAGRYYDRNNFNNTVDELSRTVAPVGVVRFSPNGTDRRGQQTVAWDPSYLTREGLLQLLAANPDVGLPELLVTKNDARPPVNDQVSLGVRQRVGVFQASLSGSYQRGRNGYTYLWGTRRGDGTCCDADLLTTVRGFGYQQVLIGFDGLDTRYKALFFTLDKNYTPASGWGLNISYTLGKAERTGNDLFSLDEIVPSAYGWRPTIGDERHRLVMSGIVDLPLGFQFSTLSTFGSGQAYNVIDTTEGTEPGQRRYTVGYPEKNCIGIFAFCEVNLTLANRFKPFGRDSNHEVEFAVDLLNAFNNKNAAGFDEGINLNARDGQGNPRPDILEPATLANANSLLTLPRRIQFRIGYRF